MKKNAETFLSKTLGSDFLESFSTSLSKSEVYKQGTRTITDTDDLFQGLQIVPRALLSLLVRELSPMQIGDTKEIQIPGNEDTKVITTKHERDSYSGQIIQNNVKISDFLHRSLLGLGLVLMTMLELYDLDDLDKKPSIDKSKESEINRIIDERMHLHSLVNKVVDGKMMHRDAISQLFMGKLNELYKEQQKIKEDHKEIMAPQTEPKPPVVVVLEIKKKRPLSDFIENRKKNITSNLKSLKPSRAMIVGKRSSQKVPIPDVYVLVILTKKSILKSRKTDIISDSDAAGTSKTWKCF
jgi:hypothetical protein